MPLKPGPSHLEENFHELRHGEQYARTAKKHGTETARSQMVAIALKEARKHRAHGGRAAAEAALPPDHELGMRVPKGGSMCANCKFLATATTCGNKGFVQWNGGEKLPAPADQYCCDNYQSHSPRRRAEGGSLWDENQDAMTPETYVNPLVDSAIRGMADFVKTPGTVMQAENPYPAGSEEWHFFEGTRQKAIDDWANNAAMTTMGTGAFAGVPIYPNEVVAGAGPIRNIYRGEYSGNKGGNFWSEDPEFARQFTQSGRPQEILKRSIDEDQIHVPESPVYAGNELAVDKAIADAKSAGKNAVLLSEGKGEPDSIFVFNRYKLGKYQPGKDDGGAVRNPAVANALDAARRAKGGKVKVGPIRGSEPGREDVHEAKVANGGYILNADTVSHMGQNNSESGLKKAQEMFGLNGHYDKSAPHHRESGGGVEGEDNPVDCILAGGEFSIHPRVVRKIGGGDIDRGHRILDKFQTDMRKDHIRVLSQLPGPARD